WQHPEPSRGLLDILVTASREVDDDRAARAQLTAEADRSSKSVRGLDRWQDPLGAAEKTECLHRLRIGDRPVLGTADVSEERVLGAGAGVIKSGRERVRGPGLTVLVLKHVRLRAVQHAGPSTGDRRGVAAGLHTVACRFATAEPHAVVVQEGVEDADRV